MTTYAKPAKIPLWAMTTANILEPSAGKKNEGWAVDDVPPSSYENWRSKTVAQWFQWFDERFFDGSTPTPEESLLLKMNGVDSFLFTEFGARNLTNTFAFEDTGDFGTFWSATFSAVFFDFLSQPNTGLYYDKVTDEFQFRIASSVDSFAVDGDGYLKIGNQPASGNAPAFGMLDRRGADTSGKLWIWQVNGAAAQYVLEQFTQGGSSEGNALAIDGSTVLKRWQFIANATYGTVLEPTTDYLTNAAGFLGAPTRRWTEGHIATIYEPERAFGYSKLTSDITGIASGAVTVITPDLEILTKGVSIDGTGKMTMPLVKGIYEIKASFVISGTAANMGFTIDLWKNNVNQNATSRYRCATYQGSSYRQIVTVTYTVQTTALTDYFEIKIDHSTGGQTLSVYSESQMTVACLRQDA